MDLTILSSEATKAGVIARLQFKHRGRVYYIDEFKNKALMVHRGGRLFAIGSRATDRFAPEDFDGQIGNCVLLCGNKNIFRSAVEKILGSYEHEPI